MSGLLSVREVDKRFGGVRAVTNLSFDVAPNTITGLIGPNGAGKSTTIELLSGFIKPDRGEILLDGVAIQGRLPHEVSRLGLIRSFQLSREWPALTVLENMLAAAVDKAKATLWRAVCLRRQLATDQRAAIARAQEILTDFGLIGLQDDLASTLSGGQKRLLEFARIVMAEPRIVLLDEPLAGVSPLMGARVQEAIRAFANRGITVLLVEHNLKLIEDLCSNVVVMALGTEIATGPMSELRSNPIVIDAYFGSNA